MRGDRGAARTTDAALGEPARAVGIVIGNRTLIRWLEDPELAEAFRAARGQALSRATARLQQVAGPDEQ